MKKLYSILVLLFFLNNIFAQNISEDEKLLYELFEKIGKTQTDKSKDSINKQIIEEFNKTLAFQSSFEYNFEKLKNISILKSNDNLIKIYTWNLVYENGNYKYFGFLQYFEKQEKKYKYLELNDKSEQIQNPETAILTPQKWFGALYYKILEYKYKKQTQYILLAWDGNNNFTNKKLIEVLYFNEENLPFFGKPVFSQENKIYSRLIFEYAEQAKMILNYDPKYEMIIWDHLSPSKPELNGQFQYYGPDFSYDGIYFEKGNWKILSNIDVKNEE